MFPRVKIQSVVSSSERFARTSALSLLAGLATGLTLWSLLHQFLASVGYTTDSQCALLFVIGMVAIAPTTTWWKDSFTLPNVSAILAAVTVVSFLLCPAISPWLISNMAMTGAAVSVCKILVGVLCLGGPLLLFRLLFSSTGIQNTGFLTSVVIGVIGNAFWLAPFWGLQAGAFTGAILLCSVTVIAFLLPSWQSSTISSRIEYGPHERGVLPYSMLLAVLAGVALGTTRQVIGELMPKAVYLDAVTTASLISGFALGSTIASKFTSHRAQIRLWGALLAVGTVGISMVSYPWLTDWQLDANAYIRQVPALMLIRSLTIGLFLFVPATGLGMIASRRSTGWAISFAAVSSALAMEWLLPELGVSIVVVGCVSGLLLCLVGASFDSVPRTKSWRQFPVILSLTTLVLLAATIFSTESRQPSRSAKLLFNSAVFIEKHHLQDSQLLEVTDAARCLHTLETPDGPLTVWLQNGVQYRVHENGVPQAVVSTETRICPHPTAEVLKVLFPLVLHEAPRQVLLLGDRGGATVDVCVDLPIDRIDYVLPQGNASREALDLIWLFARENPFADLRVTTKSEHELQSGQSSSYDVIMDDPGFPSLPEATGHFARAYYQQISGHLSPHGFFAQRLRQLDLGPEPLRALLSSASNEFSSVSLLEIGSGELLLVATNSDRGLVRPGLADRLQQPFYREQFARLGWDWSIPLNLTLFEHDAIQQFVTSGSKTFGGQKLAYLMPKEVMRWGAKWQELMTELAPHRSRLAEFAMSADNLPDLLHRLEEVTGQRELVARYPDQPWAYRKELRERIQKEPRSVIQQVSGSEPQRALHPEDQRRVDYFKTLGQALSNPTEEHILRVEEFARPFDPLLSPFVMSECARLWQSFGDEGQAKELEHRLHAIFFANASDRSVRDVTRAIQLLASNDSLVADRQLRADYVDSLLQILKQRWDQRGQSTPAAPEVVLNDIQQSLEAVEAGNRLLKSTPNAQENSLHFKQRERYLEQTLRRPLQSYRTRLLPHQQKK
ncbi:MFS transporter [Calycomorphotria hydatis]|uniref:Lipid II flippase MurJ n=1 Tax=Calycomorphotria hydatis TaxID=2528027 RepID=A0A517T787_9PLAN|nr:spermidine synthase [Calycomorphotria hydatis]QDT64236.1 Lipid II flippase MurJ [Calycomorphotria hydatis]